MLLTSEKKERYSWYIYDFANSVFSATVITVFLGPYLTSIAENAAVNGHIEFLFFNIAAGSLYPLVASLSVILQVLVLPFIASLADNSNYKKTLLILSAYIGAIATCGLFFLSGTEYTLGSLLFILANISFGCSCTLYNSYLRHISIGQNPDVISSNGWASGYIGGGILLILNLLLYHNAETLGIADDMAIRICLVSAGVWWGIFTLFPAKYLHSIKVNKHYQTKRQLLTHSVKDLLATIKEARNYPQTLVFLVAYMLYNDGVQSVIVLASQFGSAELGLQMDVLITAILIVQFVAFFGSLIIKNIAIKLTALTTLKITILVWVIVIIYTYVWMYSIFDFYLVCAVVGFIMGGTQALSRSIYAKLIPLGKEAEYFSVYELSEKGTSWLGPLAFALIYNFTQSYRLAILSLIIFFALGFLLLFRVRSDKLQSL
jgi:UMF1 family MFS transporter